VIVEPVERVLLAVADDVLVDRGLDLAVRQHVALEGGVVVDERDPQASEELLAHRRVDRCGASPPGLDDAVDLREACVDVFGFFVPEHGSRLLPGLAGGVYGSGVTPSTEYWGQVHTL
jgi:hypothetical protein